ncbi:MAG: hypothetical protein ABIF82_07990 [Planctomycetota bacterium]
MKGDPDGVVKDRVFRNVTIDDPRFLSMKRHFDELKGRKVEKEDQLVKSQETKKRLEGRLEKAKKAQAIVQLVVQGLQKELEYRISNLATLGEAAVFGEDAYKFVVKFENRRGRTECDLLFEKQGVEMKPLASSGGGAIDVASLALSASFLILEGKDLVLVLDEPLKYLSRDLQPKAAEMIRQMSEKLNVQFIITSHIPELIEGADRVFRVGLENGVSRVVQEKGI